MVAYDTIQASNRLINDASVPSVSVFVGGTSGIGQLTIRALVATGASMRIYLVGRRSSAERMGAFIQELHTVNPKAEIIWTEGEVSLLAETKRVCQVIQSKESRVDLLFLTAGYAPLGGRNYTSEGLEITQALEFYSRMLFIHHLLPLLNKSEAARVVSVLAGGMERAGVDLDDLDLKKPSRLGHLRARVQVVAMMTTTMEVLAGANPGVAFVHSMPGWVDTGNVRRGVDPGSLTGWLVWLFLGPLVGLLAIAPEVSGQRYLFQSTSAAFGGRGVPWSGEPGVNSLGKKQENGLFLVGYKADCTTNAKNLAKLREQAQGPIWDHTQNVLRPYM
ncbi:hypothetical protein LQW54_004262 [Pestalotiopsis sp. IQ-011]